MSTVYPIWQVKEGEVTLFHKKEYKTMVVTLEGSIIRMIPSGKKPKPETDPNWVDRKAERKAKEAHAWR